jgi:hypothetical protein
MLPMVTRRCVARSVMPELPHAFEDPAAVRNGRSRSCRSRPMITRSCAAHSTMPELSHALDDGTAVYTQCCQWTDRPTDRSSVWESALYPGEAF